MKATTDKKTIGYPPKNKNLRDLNGKDLKELLLRLYAMQENIVITEIKE
jgi:hypothetical protein